MHGKSSIGSTLHVPSWEPSSTVIHWIIDGLQWEFFLHAEVLAHLFTGVHLIPVRCRVSYSNCAWCVQWRTWYGRTFLMSGYIQLVSHTGLRSMLDFLNFLCVHRCWLMKLLWIFIICCVWFPTIFCCKIIWTDAGLVNIKLNDFLCHWNFLYIKGVKCTTKLFCSEISGCHVEI